jgi:hypothetical protein
LIRDRADQAPRAQTLRLEDQHLTYWSIGFSYPFLFPHLFARSLGIGVVLTGPFHRLRNFNAHNPDDFYALRYGTSDSQFSATTAASIELWPEHFYAGAGVSFFLSGAGNAEADLSQNPTGRMALDVGLESALVAGLSAKWEETRVGLAYHQELNPIFTQQIEARVPVAGTSFRQPALLKSSLYYEPHRIELEGQHTFGETKVAVGLAYELWKNYQPPILIVQTDDVLGRSHTTQLPAPAFRNTLSPRVSASYPFWNRRLALSGGYEFRPSPVEDTSGQANVLDSDTHILGVGLQHTLLPGEFFAGPTKWGLFGQYHHLTEREVMKVNQDGVGAPGYKFSGSSYTYGIFLQAEL